METAPEPAPWQVWIDTGGTFTDCIGIDPSGRLHRAKVLSNGRLRGRILETLQPGVLRIETPWSAPDEFATGFAFRSLSEPSDSARVIAHKPTVIRLDTPLQLGPGPFELDSHTEAPVLAARLITATPAETALPPIDMRLATTRATNALLERRGEPTALFITSGFAHLLRIGDQTRPDLFSLAPHRPPPLNTYTIEVIERLAPDGTVIQTLDPDALDVAIRRLREQGVRSAAVALLHSWANPAHERTIGQRLLDAGFEWVSCSADLSPTIKILPRAQTAVVNAYLSGVIARYLEVIDDAVSGLRVMTSSGGLTSAARFQPRDSLLSGPAGGVLGAARAGERAGHTRLLAFDMGGTSTDVARYDADLDYVFEHEIADVRVAAPALAIESVAAGGGSICAYENGELRVGPRSAGAAPGPACYGAGGPLTITDVNLLLGRLDEARFEIPIDPEASAARLDDLLNQMQTDTGRRPERDALLEGFFDLANEHMADAMRSVSLRRGYDPREHALVAFGGAGPQHAMAVADALGVQTVIVPRDAGLLSAVGLSRAVVERIQERQVLEPLDRVSLEAVLDELAEGARQALLADDCDADDIEIRRKLVNLRFEGQDAALTIECDGQRLEEAFLEAYERTYGHAPAHRRVEVESARVVASTKRLRFESDFEPTAGGQDSPCGAVRARFDGAWRRTPLYRRSELAPGATVQGPALVLETHSTTVVENGWSLTCSPCGALVASREGPRRTTATTEDAVRFELLTNRLGAIAIEMGDMLQRTALSTNVKERMDFSCAILDHQGELIVNAPHVPVHLGALGLCVRRVQTTINMAPGDVIVTNHPAYGGSHLPDITVIAPVHDSRDVLLGYVASRAHHAEIGGVTPGSMPPAARALDEEGVIIPPMHLIRRGRARWTALQDLLRTAPHPSRAPDENLADLAAQVAAIQRGAAGLRELATGFPRVPDLFEWIKSRADRRLRSALSRHPDGAYRMRESMDDGTPICVELKISGESARIDFSGSGDIHRGNLNATPAIVQAAVIYVLRLLVREDLPLNEGLLRAVDLHLPRGLLNPDFESRHCPAVAGGNVETSQRIVNAMLGALQLAGSSQGTMNNLCFGTDAFGYYETICGGIGATDGAHGADAMHSHMTNTRITDPEILEHRYPIRLDCFKIRPDSGGRGRWNGGNGVLRQVTFLAPMTVSLLTQNRTAGPKGCRGGLDGKPGRQYILRRGGEKHDLLPIDGTKVEAGDRLVIVTPGGGGFGRP